jgi:hypothetical protein
VILFFLHKLKTIMPPRRAGDFVMDVDSDSDVDILDEPNGRSQGKGKGKATDKSGQRKGKSKGSEVGPVCFYCQKAP